MESHLTTVQQDFSHLSIYLSVTALHFFFVSLHFPNVHLQTHPVWISLPFPSLLIYLFMMNVCFSYLSFPIYPLAFLGGSVVKNLPADAGYMGSTPGSGRSPEEEMATHSSIPAWKIPWTEEPGGLHSMGLQRAEWLSTYTHTHTHTHLFILDKIKAEETAK